MKVEIPRGYLQLIIQLLKEHIEMCMSYGFKPNEWQWIINKLELQEAN